MVSKSNSPKVLVVNVEWKRLKFVHESQMWRWIECHCLTLNCHRIQVKGINNRPLLDCPWVDVIFDICRIRASYFCTKLFSYFKTLALMKVIGLFYMLLNMIHNILNFRVIRSFQFSAIAALLGTLPLWTMLASF